MILTVNGMADTQAQFKRIIRGCAAMASTTMQVGSRIPYAYGQETGRHRKSGKLARRAGAATYLDRAKTQVLREADRDLGEGLTRVSAPGAWVIRRLAKWVRRLARQNAPRGAKQDPRSGHPGRLRRSIHIERGA